MSNPSAEDIGELLFEKSRTHTAWLPRDVPDAVLHRLYDRLRWAPTSANSNPGRFVFIRSAEARQPLKPFLWPSNVEKTMAASVTAIVASDPLFYNTLPEIFPNEHAQGMFANDATLAADTATRNATLQGGYLILAARSQGLDCGPMAAFDRAGVDQAFFPDGHWRSEFLINLGYGDPTKTRDRKPRLGFDQACTVV